jgi:ABC-type Fe3+/spermidine/putrescine transport system ATPase subunit
VVFDGFAVPRSGLEDGTALPDTVTFSVRPQSLRLLRAAPAGGGRPVVPITIAERAYLGDSWTYTVAPASGALRLRVSAAPLEIYQVGDAAWLELDPGQMAAIT